MAGVSLACARQSDHRGEQWQGRMLPVLAAVSSAGRQRDLSHTRPGLQMARICLLSICNPSFSHRLCFCKDYVSLSLPGLTLVSAQRLKLKHLNKSLAELGLISDM